MKSRLFHTIVVCGAALGGLPLGCAAAVDQGLPAGEAGEPSFSQTDANTPDTGHEDRCSLPEGGCNEHCSALGDGGCLDPCFVHTTTCSPDCLLLDGSCGWPPTK